MPIKSTGQAKRARRGARRLNLKPYSVNGKLNCADVLLKNQILLVLLDRGFLRGMTVQAG